MIEATTSAVTQNYGFFDLNGLLKNPFVQYIISPAVVFSCILFFAYKLLNLGELKANFKNALKNIGALEKDVKSLLKDMGIVTTHLVDKTGLDSGLLSRHSPLSLNPSAIEILNKSGFKKIFDENKNWFIDQLKKYPIKTLADVDEASYKFMLENQNNEKFSKFKETAFQSGIPLILLLRIISIYLRDEIGEQLLIKKEQTKSK